MAKYQILPPLTAEELARLTESIRQHGVKVPVIKDENGEIIDGHNRAMIADSLGIRYESVVEVGLPEHEKRILALSLNVDRRQVTDAQRVLAAESVEEDYRERARRRMAEAGAKAAPGKPCATAQPFQKPVTTRDEVAKAVGIGHGSTYERQKDLVNEARDLFGSESVNRRIETGAVNLRELSKQVQEERAAVSERLLEGIADPDDLAMDRMRVEFAKGIKHLGELIRLQPDAVAASLESDRLPAVRMRLNDARLWIDAVEHAIEPRGLRVVS